MLTEYQRIWSFNRDLSFEGNRSFCGYAFLSYRFLTIEVFSTLNQTNRYYHSRSDRTRVKCTVPSYVRPSSRQYLRTRFRADNIMTYIVLMYSPAAVDRPHGYDKNVSPHQKHERRVNPVALVKYSRVLYCDSRRTHIGCVIE